MLEKETIIRFCEKRLIVTYRIEQHKTFSFNRQICPMILHYNNDHNNTNTRTTYIIQFSVVLKR